MVCFFAVSSSYLYFHSNIVYSFLHPLTLLKESLYIRIILWAGIIALIMKSPIIGYGLGEKAEFYLRPNTSLYYNAHNAFLQTMYEGGIITMLTIIITVFITSKKLKKALDREAAGIFQLILFCEFIMYLSAIPSWYTWYPVLLISQIAVCTVHFSEETNEA